MTEFNVDVHLDYATNLRLTVACNGCGAMMPARLVADPQTAGYILLVPDGNLVAEDWKGVVRAANKMGNDRHKCPKA